MVDGSLLQKLVDVILDLGERIRAADVRFLGQQGFDLLHNLALDLR